jgi:hypothetical protein
VLLERLLKKPKVRKHSNTTTDVPRIDLSDLESINIECVPLQTRLLLRQNSGAISTYDSPSEVDAAIVSSLICESYSFEKILSVFVRHQAQGGKFQRLFVDDSQRAVDYLWCTFNNQIDWWESLEQTREMARKIGEWASERAWPGRTGPTDRALLLAHCAYMEKYGDDEYTYSASVRDLAEAAGIVKATVSVANRRLIEQQILEIVDNARRNRAARFRIIVQPVLHNPAPRSVQNAHNPNTTNPAPRSVQYAHNPNIPTIQYMQQ